MKHIEDRIARQNPSATSAKQKADVAVHVRLMDGDGPSAVSPVVLSTS